jgi:signal transduction histidine kinase
VSSAKMLVGVAERKLPDVGDSLHQADLSLSKAVHELRLLSKSLNSEWLEQFNFLENLETEANRINSSGEITMTVVHDGALQLAKDRQLIVFRIVQEAFQNSLKHGRPSLINIHVKQQEDKLFITVEDNGKGFDTKDTSKQGFGMTSMKHRALLMGGEVHWRADNNGTRVTIEIPHGHEN